MNNILSLEIFPTKLSSEIKICSFDVLFTKFEISILLVFLNTDDDFTEWVRTRQMLNTREEKKTFTVNYMLFVHMMIVSRKGYSKVMIVECWINISILDKVKETKCGVVFLNFASTSF